MGKSTVKMFIRHICIIIAIFGFTGIAFWDFSFNLQQFSTVQGRMYLREYARHRATQLSDMFYADRAALLALSDLAEYMESDNQEAITGLMQKIVGYASFDSMLIGKEDGSVLDDSGEKWNISHLDKSVLSENYLSVLEPQEGTAERRFINSVTAAPADNTYLAAFLCGIYKAEEIEKRLGQDSFDGAGSYYIVGSDGRVLAESKGGTGILTGVSDLYGILEEFEFGYGGSAAEFKAAISGQKEYFADLEYKDFGRTYLTCVPMKINDWSICAEVPAGGVLKGDDKLRRIEFSFVIKMVMILSLISFYVISLVQRKGQGENLRLRLQMVENSNLSRTRFFANMSHDMRTPMNVIIGMVKMMELEGGLSEKNSESLKKIEISSKYLLALMNDVLDMAKAESGTLQLTAETFDLSILADEIREMVLPQAEQKGLEFCFESEVPKGRIYSGDRVRMEQVIMNLLSNSLKFTREGGRIGLTVCQKLEQDCRVFFEITVTDTGYGISEENLKRIFIPFEQVVNEEDISASRQGAGLGLAISRQIALEMGGDIRVESEPGRGSRFTFTVPLAKEGCGKDCGPAAGETRDYDFTGKKILLAEDNEINAEIAVALFEQMGFQVEAVKDGKQALTRFEAGSPWEFDIILMDIMMPVMGGLEAAAGIRSLAREDAGLIPIFALSANAFQEDVARSLASGMNEHISKPFREAELYQLFGKYLIEQKERQE